MAAFAAPKGLRPRRRYAPRHDESRVAHLVENALAYWLAHRMRAIQASSESASARSSSPSLSGLSSIVFAVLRLSSATLTSSLLVLITMRSPRRIGAAGDTTMM